MVDRDVADALARSFLAGLPAELAGRLRAGVVLQVGARTHLEEPAKFRDLLMNARASQLAST